MKKTAKSVLALCTAAMLMTASGCADTSWSFKTDDETLSNGAYIYYTYAAYTDAYSKVEDTSKDVLEQKVEDKDAVEWIQKKAKEECITHLTMTRLFNEKKLKVDEKTKTDYEDYAEQIYDYYYASAFETMGISKETYVKCTGTYSAYSQLLFESIYDTDGTKAVVQEDIEKYFTENYTDFYYISKPLTETDSDGNTVDISDEDKETIVSNFKNYAEIINTDKKTKDDVVEEYKKDYETEGEPGYSATTVLADSGLSDDLQKAIEELEEGKATTIEVNKTYYFIYKGKISDKLSTLEDTEANKTSRLTVLHKMKDEEYNAYLEEEEKNTKYEQNDACISKYTVNRLSDILNQG